MNFYSNLEEVYIIYLIYRQLLKQRAQASLQSTDAGECVSKHAIQRNGLSYSIYVI